MRGSSHGEHRDSSQDARRLSLLTQAAPRCSRSYRTSASLPLSLSLSLSLSLALSLSLSHASAHTHTHTHIYTHTQTHNLPDCSLRTRGNAGRRRAGERRHERCIRCRGTWVWIYFSAIQCLSFSAPIVCVCVCVCVWCVCVCLCE